MCCIRMAAYLTAWRDAGLARAVDHAITVSGSGGALGAYLSGLPHRAVQMFEHLAVSGFVTGTSWYKRRISLPRLGDVLRGLHSPVAFQQNLICGHRTSWHVVVTRLTGESFLLDAKSAQARRGAGRAGLQRLPAHDIADPGRRRRHRGEPGRRRLRHAAADRWPASSASGPTR